MSEHIVTIIVAVIASEGIWTGLFALLMKKKGKRTAEDEALVGLLHDRIYGLCKEYLRAGEVSTEQLDNLRHLYEPYIALGGNSTAKRLYEEVQELKISN